MTALPDQNYLDLLAGQLVGQATTAPDLAADLADFTVPDDTPNTVARSAKWARWLASGIGTSVKDDRSIGALTRSWPTSIGVQDFEYRRGEHEAELSATGTIN